jgi:hypothetical protein
LPRMPSPSSPVSRYWGGYVWTEWTSLDTPGRHADLGALYDLITRSKPRTRGRPARTHRRGPVPLLRQPRSGLCRVRAVRARDLMYIGQTTSCLTRFRQLRGALRFTLAGGWRAPATPGRWTATGYLPTACLGTSARRPTFEISWAVNAAQVGPTAKQRALQAHEAYLIGLHMMAAGHPPTAQFGGR